MPLELKPRVRLATRRKRARLIGVSLACLVTIGLTFCTSLLSYNDRFAIRDITVIGAQALSPAEVESKFGLQINDGIRHFLSRANIFVYPQKELREALLRELPLLKSVSFTRESLLSQAVIITITEREPAFLWCKDECYFMDSRGFIFMKAENPGSFLEFRGGLLPHVDPVGQQFMKGRLDNLVLLVGRLKAEGYPVRSTTVENERDISVRFENGLIVKLVLDADSTEISRNLSLILASEAFVNGYEGIEYVDLRFGNRVYYKLKL